MDENCSIKIVNDSLHLQQIELTQKYISLQVLRDLQVANNKTILQKKDILKNRNNDLDNLHHAVWSLQSKSCDMVWDFSSKHDFNAIFNNYPETSSLISFNCNCELQDVRTMQQDAEAQKILIEITKLESNLEIANCNTLKADLMKANDELYECENEISEIERLKKSITESKQRIQKFKSRTEIQTSRNESLNDLTLRNPYVLSKDMAYSSPDSSMRDPSLEKIDCNLHHVKPAILLANNNIKRKWTNFGDASSSNATGFIKASTLINGSENQTQFKNTPLCEKIVAEAVSNERKHISSTSVEKSRKKFVPKTQSLITQRLKH